MTKHVQGALSYYATSHIFYGAMSLSSGHCTGVLTFPTTMALASDLAGAQLVLWPGTGNEWHSFGMNAGTLNYNYN